MSLGPRSEIRQARRIATRTIAGRAVVIVIDARKMHTLDSVATFIWERAEQPRAIASIADDVVERFEVEPERALQDVLRFADHLVELGALEVENPGL